MATKACFKAQTQIPTLPAQAIISQVRTESKQTALARSVYYLYSICNRVSGNCIPEESIKIFFNVHHSSPAAFPVTVCKQGLF